VRVSATDTRWASVTAGVAYTADRRAWATQALTSSRGGSSARYHWPPKWSRVLKRPRLRREPVRPHLQRLRLTRTPPWRDTPPEVWSPPSWRTGRWTGPSPSQALWSASSSAGTGTDIDLSVAWYAGALRLTIGDHGSALPGQRPAASTATARTRRRRGWPLTHVRGSFCRRRRHARLGRSESPAPFDQQRKEHAKGEPVKNAKIIKVPRHDW